MIQKLPSHRLVAFYQNVPKHEDGAFILAFDYSLLQEDSSDVNDSNHIDGNNDDGNWIRFIATTKKLLNKTRCTQRTYMPMQRIK